MSSTQIAKNFVLDMLQDGLIHYSHEIYQRAKESGVIRDEKRSAINNALYLLKKEKMIENGEDNRQYKLVSGIEERTKENNVRCVKQSTEENAEKNKKLSDVNNETDQKSKIDWNEYVLLEPTKGRHQELKVRINDKGEIRLYKALMKKLETNKIELIFSKDYHSIILNPNGCKSHVFSSSGTVRNRTVIELLKKHKLEFPVEYNVYWNEELKMYEGTVSSDVKLK